MTILNIFANKESPYYNRVSTLATELSAFDSTKLIAAFRLQGMINATESLQELYRFIILKALYLDFDDSLLAPSKEIDRLWNILLQFPTQYVKLGEKLVGNVLDRNPLKGQHESKEQYRITLSRYAKVFGESAPQKYWPVDEYGQSKTVDEELADSATNKRKERTVSPEKAHLHSKKKKVDGKRIDVRFVTPKGEHIIFETVLSTDVLTIASGVCRKQGEDHAEVYFKGEKIEVGQTFEELEVENNDQFRLVYV
jgi:hypothetical protein